VKWSHALMQLFWTAGPVTTLGLIGGYYIGYGTMPSMELLIYFVSFTVFSGIIGLIAKVVYDGTRGHLAEQSERDVLSVIDKLGDLILVARDKVVQGFEGDARDREAALQLLRRVDLTPYGVNIAFTDLTGNREIGEVMGRLFAYRRIGLQTKVRELYAGHRNLIEKEISNLQINSPKAAKELKLWFTGNTSGRLKYGVQREKYFLQRIMAAIENNNPYLMTFRDVEEMMILAFELINGREVPTLIFSYSGKWRYATALDELEKRRSNYRVAQARGGNRLRALAAYLVETGISTPEELSEGTDIETLAKGVAEVVNRLSDQIKIAVRDRNLSQKELERLADIMSTSVELFQMAYDGYKESGKRHKELIQAANKWNKIASGATETLKVGSGKRGIRIRESVILLDEEARLEVCRHLSWYFQKEDIKKRSHSLFSSFNNRGGMSARRLAIEIAVALEPHIRLSKPEIQRNINATKAIYLGGLSPDMSAVQKQELGRRMASEVENGLGISAIRLAETLVNQYHAELSEEAIEFLSYNYNAGVKSLRRIMERGKSSSVDMQSLSEIPPQIERPDPEWLKSLQLAKKAAEKARM